MPSTSLTSGVATFTVTATISGSATGNVVNTATATVPAGTTDPTPGNNTATDTDTVSLVADLAVTKTDGSATYTPGNAITYTIVVSNNGPSAVTGATGDGRRSRGDHRGARGPASRRPAACAARPRASATSTRRSIC